MGMVVEFCGERRAVPDDGWLAPGARLPVVFAHAVVRFTAGPTGHEVELHLPDAVTTEPVAVSESTGETTIGPTPFTPDQHRLVVALAEPRLRQPGRGTGAVPSSAEAADRLGWTGTRFNRKLDNVCAKLAKVGVQGLHGGPGALASNRRARLVEHAIAVRLVTAGDLAPLDGDTALDG